jgi:hypothetical protein
MNMCFAAFSDETNGHELEKGRRRMVASSSQEATLFMSFTIFRRLLSNLFIFCFEQALGTTFQSFPLFRLLLSHSFRLCFDHVLCVT